MLLVDDIHFSYANKKILKGLSFSVKKKEIIALIGISGSGKTTLFRLITGLSMPNRGKIEFEGRSQKEKVTYMRQEDLLLPWRTVLGNLLLFAELGSEKRDFSALKEEALYLLESLGLGGREKDYPHELSGGMRQRVSLARALLQKRPLLLLDEPFASLDILIREQLYQLLKKIRDNFDQTIIMVTHDFYDALSLADRMLILSNGKILDSFQVEGETEVLIQRIRTQLSSTIQN